MNIGLVVEGRHDFLMLHPLIEAELLSRGISDFTITDVHPTSDETGTISNGGWKKIKAWLQDNGGNHLDSFFTPLFATVPALDLIVIHVDGDILLDACRSSGVPCPALPVSTDIRVACIGQAIEKWADFRHNRDKAIFAIPVNSTESWILAAEATHHDIETMNAKDEFRRTYSRDKHISLLRFYEMRADGAKNRIAHIANQCASYLHFQEQLAEAIL